MQQSEQTAKIFDEQNGNRKKVDEKEKVERKKKRWR